jgi:hypothetical protein
MEVAHVDIVGGWGIRVAKAYDAITDKLTVTIHNTGSKGGGGSFIAGAGIDIAGPVISVKDASVTEAKLLLADNTTGDVSIARHGLAPKAPNDADRYLDATAAWSIPKSFKFVTVDPAAPTVGVGYLNTVTNQGLTYDGTRIWRFAVTPDPVTLTFDLYYELLFGTVDLAPGFSADWLAYELFN